MKRCVGERNRIADQRVLRWFGHVVRMDEYRTAKRALMAEVSGEQLRGRPRLARMEGVDSPCAYATY